VRPTARGGHGRGGWLPPRARPLLAVLALYAAGLHAFNTCAPATAGASMLPLLPVASARILMLPWWNARGRRVRVGDVVAALDPRIPGERVVKRVVGMGGDWVAVGDGEKCVLVGFALFFLLHSSS
jgi:hypothetical protein